MTAYVSSEVASPRTISTSCITTGGFMKCIPMTLSGRAVTAPSRVSEIDEVLLARITPGRTTSSSRRKIVSLIAASSGAASMMTSASANSASSSVPRSRSRMARRSSAGSLPRSVRRTRFFWMTASARSTMLVLTSYSTTASPACAATCAMPPPICPDPTMPTVRISPLIGLLPYLGSSAEDTEDIVLVETPSVRSPDEYPATPFDTLDGRSASVPSDAGRRWPRSPVCDPIHTAPPS